VRVLGPSVNVLGCPITPKLTQQLFQDVQCADDVFISAQRRLRRLKGMRKVHQRNLTGAVTPLCRVVQQQHAGAVQPHRADLVHSASQTPHVLCCREHDPRLTPRPAPQRLCQCGPSGHLSALLWQHAPACPPSERARLPRPAAGQSEAEERAGAPRVLGGALCHVRGAAERPVAGGETQLEDRRARKPRQKLQKILKGVRSKQCSHAFRSATHGRCMCAVRSRRRRCCVPGSRLRSPLKLGVKGAMRAASR